MIKLASPAKVNLFLRVLRRRSDGYHELASLFQTIDLCDQLQMSLSDRDELHCNEPKIPTDRSNLVWKAVDLYRQKTGRQFTLKIILDKQIPSEAGLGGGSSNAATALWGVNRLLGNPVSSTLLFQWAAEVGSDVSFFLSSGTAYCTGRGEVVRDLPPLKEQAVWIFKPAKGLSTPAVYNQLRIDSLPKRDPEACLSAFFDGNPSYFNDLEEPAFALLPELSQLKSELLSLGFKHSFLTGSGTAFVCIGEPKKSLPGIFQKQANFINRSLEKWYHYES
jgi:4-diphosphocytidyl-2-C-methyl-D-erythritol kinase